MHEAHSRSVSVALFMKTCGKLQHAGMICPALSGHMTPLNQVIAHAEDAGATRAGLGCKNKSQTVLENSIHLIQQLQARPALLVSWFPHTCTASWPPNQILQFQANFQGHGQQGDIIQSARAQRCLTFAR